jgi:hypothetical protein
LAKWYECTSETDRIIVGSDLEDAKWVDKKDVPAVCGERVVGYWCTEVRAYFGF